MKLKRTAALLLALLLALGCFPAAQAAEEGTLLYDKQPPASQAEAVRQWPSNSNRPSMGKFIPNGSTEAMDLLQYYNNRGSDGSGLPAKETMAITVPELELKTGDWGGMELTFRYVTYNNYVDVRLTGDFQVWASTDGGQSWSETCAGMADCIPVCFGASDKGAEGRCYDVISTDIAGLVPRGRTINALKIKPYGDSPAMQYNTCIAGISVAGYKDGVPERSQKTEYISVPEATLRQIVVDHAYTVALTPWTTDEKIDTYNASGLATYPESVTQHYLPGWLYKGPAYSRGLDSTLEMWRAGLEGTKDTGGKTDQTVCGWDCIQVVAEGWSRVAPAGSATSHLFYRTGAQALLAGGLKNEQKLNRSADIVGQHTPQQIYEAYAAMKMGDHLLNDGHSRLVTEAPKVVRKDDGTVDAERSALGVTEEAGTVLYYWMDKSGKLITTEDKDPAAYQKEHPDYTYLYGSSCRVDRWLTFANLIAGAYAPYTLKEFAEGRVEKQRLRAFSSATAENVITNGFEAIVLSDNYHVNALSVTLWDQGGSEALYQNTRYGETHDFELNVWDPELNKVLAGLTPGSYTLSIDAHCGPVTRVQGKAPVQRVYELAFTVN